MLSKCITKHYTKNNVTYEVMTYYPLGSLGDNVDIFKGNFELQKELFDQLLDGIKFLHSKNIQHRDLKTGNVLVESLEPLQIKVCDFGRSRANANSMSITQSVGTFKFMAPESLAGMPTEKSDLFSLGMIMAVIGTKGHGDPFANSGHLTDNELDWDKINVDNAMKNIIKGLTIKDQYKRGVSAFKEGWVVRLNTWLSGLLSSTPSGGDTYTRMVADHAHRDTGGSPVKPTWPVKHRWPEGRKSEIQPMGWHSGSKLVPPYSAPPRHDKINDNQNTASGKYSIAIGDFHTTSGYYSNDNR